MENGWERYVTVFFELIRFQCSNIFIRGNIDPRVAPPYGHVQQAIGTQNTSHIQGI